MRSEHDPEIRLSLATQKCISVSPLLSALHFKSPQARGILESLCRAFCKTRGHSHLNESRPHTVVSTSLWSRLGSLGIETGEKIVKLLDTCVALGVLAGVSVKYA